MSLSGVFFVAVGITLSSLPLSALEDGNLAADDFDIDDFSGIPPSLIGGGPIAIGSIMIAIGIVSFIVAYGLLKGIGSAWTVTIVLSIINIALNVIIIATIQPLVWLGLGIMLPAATLDPPPPLPPGGIISMTISGIIIHYLYRPKVKAYFGKAAARTDTSLPAA